MRTLKFRYWNTITKEMVNNPKMPYKENWTIEQLFEDRGWMWMQFTGLTDRHGVEIYEGDIVRAGFDGALAGTIVFGMYKPVMNTDEWEGHQSFYIEWNDWDGMTRGELGYWLQKNMETQAYVIGNIYENPELLK